MPAPTISRTTARVAICQLKERSPEIGPALGTALTPQQYPGPLLDRGDSRAAEHTRDLRCEIPASGKHGSHIRIGDQLPVPEQHHSISEPHCELDIVGRDDQSRAAIGHLRAKLAEPVLEVPVHAPGRLVQRDEAGQLLAIHAAGQGYREREPLALTAREVPGVRVRLEIETDGGEGSAALGPRKLVADPVPDDEIAGILGQEGHATGRLDLAGGCLDETRGRSEQRRLAGTVPAHQGYFLSGLDPEVDPPEHVHRPVAGIQFDPESVAGQGPAPLSARRLHFVPAGGSCLRGLRCVESPDAQRRPGIADPDRQRVNTGPREHSGRGRCQGRSLVDRVLEELSRGPVEDNPSAFHRDDTIRGGQTAFEAMFSQHHCHPPLFVQAAQQPDQFIAGDRVQL